MCCIKDINTQYSRFSQNSTAACNVIYIYIYIKQLLQPLSSNVLIAVNRVICIYFGFLTEATMIGHYTVFHGLIYVGDSSVVLLIYLNDLRKTR